MYYIPNNKTKQKNTITVDMGKIRTLVVLRLILQFKPIFILHCIWRVARVLLVLWVSKILSKKKSTKNNTGTQ